MEESRSRDLYDKYRFLKGALIVIEGNIASGKSTFTESLVAFLNGIGLSARLYKEPILQSYLDTFLTDMKKYAFGFQMSMLIENQCLYGDALHYVESGGIAILDRSFMGNRAFALLHNQYGNITDAEMKVYDDVYNRMVRQRSPTYTLYLEVDPEINVNRCRLRDRSCESQAYDIQYFSDLNNTYRKLINELSKSQKVVVFDWNKDIPMQTYTRVLMNVLDYLRQDYLLL